MKVFYVFLLLIIPFSASLAQGRGRIHRNEPSKLSWDLGASLGTYGGESYSELDLGLSYHLSNYLNWRNVLFSRNGVGSVTAMGLDSSLRFEFGDQSEDKTMSYKLFAGPGVRLSNAATTGVFGEAGVFFHLGGLNIGAGAKVITYSTPGKDSITGQILPSSDVTYMIFLSGGG